MVNRREAAVEASSAEGGLAIAFVALTRHTLALGFLATIGGERPTNIVAFFKFPLVIAADIPLITARVDEFSLGRGFLLFCHDGSREMGCKVKQLDFSRSREPTKAFIGLMVALIPAGPSMFCSATVERVGGAYQREQGVSANVRLPSRRPYLLWAMSPLCALFRTLRTSSQKSRSHTKFRCGRGECHSQTTDAGRGPLANGPANDAMRRRNRCTNRSGSD